MTYRIPIVCNLRSESVHAIRDVITTGSIQIGGGRNVSRSTTRTIQCTDVYNRLTIAAQNLGKSS